MKKIFLIAAVVAAIFVSVSCEKKSQVREDAFAGDWVLTAYEKGSENLFSAELERPVELSVFEADEIKNGFRIGGFSGVNNFMGGAKAFKDGTVKIEFNASTMMAGRPEDEEFERNYIENMKSVTNFTFNSEGDTMTLSGDNVKFTFKKKQL